jgi:hypothetical protein
MSIDWTSATLLRKFAKLEEKCVTETFACITCSFKTDDWIDVLGSRLPNAKRQAVAKNGPDYRLACGHTVRPLIGEEI